MTSICCLSVYSLLLLEVDRDTPVIAAVPADVITAGLCFRSLPQHNKVFFFLLLSFLLLVVFCLCLFHSTVQHSCACVSICLSFVAPLVGIGTCIGSCPPPLPHLTLVLPSLCMAISLLSLRRRRIRTRNEVCTVVFVFVFVFSCVLVPFVVCVFVLVVVTLRR